MGLQMLSPQLAESVAWNFQSMKIKMLHKIIFLQSNYFKLLPFFIIFPTIFDNINDMFVLTNNIDFSLKLMGLDKKIGGSGVEFGNDELENNNILSGCFGFFEKHFT